MIHAWIDIILKINEIHRPTFQIKKEEINSKQDIFKLSI